jgi:pyruvate ferredoxin oxidoreductase gamma subunit
LLSSAQLVPTGRFIDTMKENGLIEFRWHGRGGQGAKTACLLLADAAFCSGKYVQGFPEYGPERMGAPITAYNRISDVRCSVHCNIENPDYVVVVDETLLDSVDVTHGLSPEGAVIVNTAHSPAQIREKLRGWQGRVCTIDARRISEETLGKNFPNTPMLAAAVKVSGVLEEAKFKKDMEDSFHHKFATKPQVVAGNMAALVQAWEEVQAG